MSLLQFLLLCMYIVFPNTSAFDYFKFVQQWPKSTCNTRNPNECLLPPNYRFPQYFTIHGWWPDNLTGPLEYCEQVRHRPFMADQRTELNREWPNIKEPTDNEKFWYLQWEKHGSCCLDFADQKFYFDWSLYWKSQFNLLVILDLAGIRPGDYYRSIDITNAIYAVTKTIPDLRCNSNPAGNNQFQEIVLCFDRDGLTLIDCPTNRLSNSCRWVVYFPA